MRTCERSLAFRRSYGQMNLAPSTFFNARSLGVEQDLDAVFAQDPRDLIGHILIFASEQLRRALHNRDAAAETPKHLPEFETDVPPAQNQQMLGQFVQLHNRSRIENRDLIEAIHSRIRGTATHVDENFFR